MKDYRYIFDGPYLTCPHCGRPGKYRNIYDRATGQPVAAGECGACFVCNFDVNAYQYFQKHPEAKKDGKPYTPPPVKPVSYLPENELTTYLVDIPLKGKANLTDYLLHMMDESDLMPVLAKYGVGADGYGAMVWPQIDTNHQIREIKVQWQDPYSGSRKGKGAYTYLLHKRLRDHGKLDSNTSHKQCLFGLHLLDKVTPDTVACIVESEKTAIICAVALPQFVWLATGSEDNFSLVEDAKSILHKCKKVVIFPDAGSESKWKKKAEEIGLDKDIFDFSNKCEGHPHNTDLADLIIYEWLGQPEKIKPMTFQEPEPIICTPEPIHTKNYKTITVPLFPEPYSYDWVTQEAWDNILSPEATPQMNR